MHLSKVLGTPNPPRLSNSFNNYAIHQGRKNANEQRNGDFRSTLMYDSAFHQWASVARSKDRRNAPIDGGGRRGGRTTTNKATDE